MTRRPPKRCDHRRLHDLLERRRRIARWTRDRPSHRITRQARYRTREHVRAGAEPARAFFNQIPDLLAHEVHHGSERTRTLSLPEVARESVEQQDGLDFATLQPIDEVTANMELTVGEAK